MMNNQDKDYYLKEAFRLLVLASMGAEGKCFELIEEAIDCLEKYKVMLDNEKIR